MRISRLGNALTAFLLMSVIVLCNIVSVKADMIKATYSPYKCSVDTQYKNKEEAKNSIGMKFTYMDLSEYQKMRKSQNKPCPELNKLKEEVRRYDVTSSKYKMVIVTKLDDCEYPVYKII